jgi:hypothetical protein
MIFNIVSDEEEKPLEWSNWVDYGKSNIDAGINGSLQNACKYENSIYR